MIALVLTLGLLLLAGSGLMVPAALTLAAVMVELVQRRRGVPVDGDAASADLVAEGDEAIRA